jgi:hypothetical protein
LPVLLHDLNNHTQYLSALNALANVGDAAPDGGAGLARTSREIEDLGWLLGLCAGATGADWLGERTERRGLTPLVQHVRKALRRLGRDLERSDRELPDLPARLGWRGARRVGEVLFACGTATTPANESAQPLDWELEAHGDALRLGCRVEPAGIPELTLLGPWTPLEHRSGWISFRIEPKEGA